MDKLLADALTGVLKEGRRHAPDVTMRQARFQLPGLVTRRDERHASAETVNAFAPYPSAARREGCGAPFKTSSGRSRRVPKRCEERRVAVSCCQLSHVA